MNWGRRRSDGVHGEGERADAGEIHEVKDGVGIALDEGGDAVVERGARAAEPVDVFASGAGLHLVELRAHALCVVEQVEGGVVAEVGAVGGVDAFDVHIVVEVLAHGGELLAVAVRKEHEGGAGVEAIALALAVEGLGAESAAGVEVLLENGDVVAGMREAGGDAEATDATANHDGGLAVAGLCPGGWRGGLGDAGAHGGGRATRDDPARARGAPRRGRRGKNQGRHANISRVV